MLCEDAEGLGVKVLPFVLADEGVGETLLPLVLADDDEDLFPALCYVTNDDFSSNTSSFRHVTSSTSL